MKGKIKREEGAEMGSCSDKSESDPREAQSAKSPRFLSLSLVAYMCLPSHKLSPQTINGYPSKLTLNTQRGLPSLISGYDIINGLNS